MSRFDAEEFLIDRFLTLSWADLQRIEDQWGYIRQAYMEFLPEILATGKEDPQRWVRAYALDWDSFMNEVEKIAWGSIRGRGTIVLYPQYPLFSRFLDFGNPVLRVGLEIDGKQHVAEADRKRDELAANIGWKIFRVPAREAYTECRDLSELTEAGIEGEERDAQLKYWLMNSLDGVVQAMEWVYFTKWENTGDEDEMSEEWRKLTAWAEETLDKHRLVAFPLRGSNFAQRTSGGYVATRRTTPATAGRRHEEADNL